jgi:hypothetical protein
MTAARWRNFRHQPRAFIARLDPTATRSEATRRVARLDSIPAMNF